MGSGGGGGASGKIDYPEYMKTWHTAFLGGATAGISLTEAMDTAMSGASPYAGFVPVNVNNALLGSGVAITDFTAPFSYLVTYCSLDLMTLVNSYKAAATGLSGFITGNNALIEEMITAEGVLIDQEVEQNIIPKYRAGYREANAVMTSAFAIGEGIIRAAKVKELTKADVVMRLEGYKQGVDLTLKNEALALEYATKQILAKRDVATTAFDFGKLYLGLKNELDDTALEVSAKDRLWDLKVFQYGGNFLGSISGSAVSTDSGKSNKAQSAIAGAVGGAAMGAMVGAQMGSVGGPWGAAIGAVAGLAYGLLS